MKWYKWSSQATRESGKENVKYNFPACCHSWGNSSSNSRASETEYIFIRMSFTFACWGLWHKTVGIQGEPLTRCKHFGILKISFQLLLPLPDFFSCAQGQRGFSWLLRIKGMGVYRNPCWDTLKIYDFFCPWLIPGHGWCLFLAKLSVSVLSMKMPLSLFWLPFQMGERGHRADFRRTVMVARWNTLTMAQKTKTKWNNNNKQYWGRHRGSVRHWGGSSLSFRTVSSWRKMCSAAFPRCCGRALNPTDGWVSRHQFPHVLHRTSPDSDHVCVAILLPWAKLLPRTELS